MNLRFALLLVALFAVNACAAHHVPTATRSIRGTREEVGSYYDALADLVERSSPRCRTSPFDSSVPAAEVIELSIPTSQLVYEVAVMSRDQMGRYPVPNPCYLEGQFQRVLSVYLRARDPAAISVTTVEPSTEVPGQAHHNVSAIVLPREVIVGGRVVTHHIECFEMFDSLPSFPYCEHRLGAAAD